MDIKLGPDGALYVADFYNCIIGHYEVPLTHPAVTDERGRILRISYCGEEVANSPASNACGFAIPDLTTASQDALIAALGHPNLPVRVQATHQLVHRIGPACVPAVSRILGVDRDLHSQWAQAHAIWVVERLGGLAEDLIQQAATDPDRLVRVHLVKAMAERPEWSSAIRDAIIRRLTTDNDAFVRRAIIEALGRHPAEGTERLLIQASLQADPADELLIHTAKIAVRDCLVHRNSFAELDAAAWEPVERANACCRRVWSA